MEDSDYILHRQIGASYPIAANAEGVYIYDSSGKRYMDAISSSFCCLIGHNVQEIKDAIADQLNKFEFANTNYFSSGPAEEFARRLIALAPAHYAKVYVCTSGSTANEAALKFARQYHILAGQPDRAVVIARRNSYHGGTIGALSMTGHQPRRDPFEPYLLPFSHIEPPYCYRCPWGKNPESCALECADALESEILRVGPHQVSAFIVEPISGGPLGAVSPPLGYLKKVEAICRRYGVLLIADEVVTGAGRTGRPLAINHSGVVPDIITMAKGIAGGYIPVGAVIIHEDVYAMFENAQSKFNSQESLSAHPLVCAIGKAVLKFAETHDLTVQAEQLGILLHSALRKSCDVSIVGDIRGKGLLQGLELVQDRVSKQPFPRHMMVAEKVSHACAERGVLVLTLSGCANGVDGDTITIAPPLTITPDQIVELASILGEVLNAIQGQICT